MELNNFMRELHKLMFMYQTEVINLKEYDEEVAKLYAQISKTDAE